MESGGATSAHCGRYRAAEKVRNVRRRAATFIKRRRHEGGRRTLAPVPGGLSTVTERKNDLKDSRSGEAPFRARPCRGRVGDGLEDAEREVVEGLEEAVAVGSEQGLSRDAVHGQHELREVLDWTIAYQLRSVDGIVEVNTLGGELKTYEVQVDPVLLRAFGLGLNDVFDALERNNVSAGGGYVAHAGEQRLIRADGLLSSLADVRAVVVSTRDDGTPIRIADIGDVHLAPMIRQGGLTRDGRGETVSGIVMMLIGANFREVSRAVDERIDELRGSLPEGVTIDTYYDRTELVDRTVRTAVTNLIEGGVLVIVVLMFVHGAAPYVRSSQFS